MPGLELPLRADCWRRVTCRVDTTSNTQLVCIQICVCVCVCMCVCVCVCVYSKERLRVQVHTSFIVLPYSSVYVCGHCIANDIIVRYACVWMGIT